MVIVPEYSSVASKEHAVIPLGAGNSDVLRGLRIDCRVCMRPGPSPCDLARLRFTAGDWSFYILGPTARCTERSFGVRAARCRFFTSQLAGGQIALKVGRRVNLM
jgi:hypothetical protein